MRYLKTAIKDKFLANTDLKAVIKGGMYFVNPPPGVRRPWVRFDIINFNAGYTSVSQIDEFLTQFTIFSRTLDGCMNIMDELLEEYNHKELVYSGSNYEHCLLRFERAIGPLSAEGIWQITLQFRTMRTKGRTEEVDNPST